MATYIENLKASPTGKRFDFDLIVKPLLKQPYQLKVRILSREVISEDDLDELAYQITERKDRAKEGKSGLSLSLNGFNANAYFSILK